MSTFIGIGFSQEADPQAAALEAARQARAEVPSDRIDAALVLSTVHYAPDTILPLIYEHLDKTKLVGSSTAALIHPSGPQSRGILIIAFYSETIRFETGHVTHLDLVDKTKAGRDLIKKTLSDFGQQERRVFCLFTDGLVDDIPALIEGVNQQVSAEIPIVGAGSSDNFHFQKTYQFFMDKPLTKAVCGLLIGGRVQIGLSCRHGWKPLGKPRVIDKAQGCLLQSIDGNPPLKIYEEYFEDQARMFLNKPINEINIRYPLGVFIDYDKEYHLCNPVKVQPDGSILCQDRVRPQGEVHLMIGNKETCFLAAEEAALDVKRQLNDEKPHLILVIESLMRYKLLGRAAGQEIEIIKKIFQDTPVVGLYSFGEIFTPHRTRTRLHNGSIIILAVK